MQWLQRPLAQTTAGYAKFLGRSQWLLLPAFYLLAGGTRLPGWLDAPLADKHAQKEMQERDGKPVSQVVQREGLGTTSGSEGTLVDPTSGQDFPLVIFSHGESHLMRIWDRELMLELDRTWRIEDDLFPVLWRPGKSRLHRRRHRAQGWLWTHQYRSTRGWSRANCRLRQIRGPIVRTPPSLAHISLLTRDHSFEKQGVEMIDFRKEQLLMRTAEVREVIASMDKINRGEGAAVGKANRRVEKSSSVDFASWRGRMGIEGKAIMTGHSFGGATTVSLSPSLVFEYTTDAHRSTSFKSYELDPPSPSSEESASTHGQSPSPPPSRTPTLLPPLLPKQVQTLRWSWVPPSASPYSSSTARRLRSGHRTTRS